MVHERLGGRGDGGARLMRGIGLFALLGASIVVACGEPGTGPAVRPPAALLIIAGDQQQDTVGAELAEALVVRVVDADGLPIAGQVVNWRLWWWVTCWVLGGKMTW